jgi:predicted nucleic acid-binding protein
VDTSVVGGCFDEEFQAWSLALFLDFRDQRYIPVLSALTSAEVGQAPEQVQRKYEELLAIPNERIELTAEAFELAGEYVGRGILSTNYENDALHIALASIGQVDILVSWNFKHVVHYDKIRRFNAVNLESGYKTIQIFSPREVVHEEK